MKLVIETQHTENYAAHDWDGKGATPDGWKFKGGETFVIKNIEAGILGTTSMYEAVVNDIAPFVEQDNDYFRDYIVDWHIEDNDWESGTVTMQREYESGIHFDSVIEKDESTGNYFLTKQYVGKRGSNRFKYVMLKDGDLACFEKEEYYTEAVTAPDSETL